MSLRLTLDWTRCTGHPVVADGPVPTDLTTNAVAARKARPALAVRLDKARGGNGR